MENEKWFTNSLRFIILPVDFTLPLHRLNARPMIEIQTKKVVAFDSFFYVMQGNMVSTSLY